MQFLTAPMDWFSFDNFFSLHNFFFSIDNLFSMVTNGSIGNTG